MSCYFVRKQPRASEGAWVPQDWTRDDYLHPAAPMVCDHDAIETGLLDANGDMIMRSPRPIGFMRDEEW